MTTCGECDHFKRCRRLGFTRDRARTECDFDPPRFRPIPAKQALPGPSAVVKGLPRPRVGGAETRRSGRRSAPPTQGFCMECGRLEHYHEFDENMKRICEDGGNPRFWPKEMV